jgi:hypothetical protein
MNKLTADPVSLKAERIAIVRAFKAGDVVFVETDHYYSMEQMRAFKQYVEDVVRETGVKMVFLEKGMRITGREETPEKVT